MKSGKSLILGAALVVVLLLSACAADNSSNGSTSPISSGPIAGTWVEVEVQGNTVTLPVSEVRETGNVHFSVSVPDGKLDFMAYLLGDVLHVRANACPPCRSRGFALDGEILVCDTCQTLFDARDGSGIEGACVAYPKAAVDYAVEGDLIVMPGAALVQAYEETLVVG